MEFIIDPGEIVSNKVNKGFPGGLEVNNLPVNARDTGLIPDPQRSHTPWST